MADLLLAQTTPSTALLTNATSLTFLQATAAAQQRVKISEVSISFAGTSNTQAEVLCDVDLQSTAGTGLSAQNPVKWDQEFGETVQTTGQKGFAQSVDPTSVNVIWIENIHPQTGLLWQAPFALEFKIKAGTQIGIRVNNSAALNGVCRMREEE